MIRENSGPGHSEQAENNKKRAKQLFPDLCVVAGAGLPCVWGGVGPRGELAASGASNESQYVSQALGLV